MVQVFREKVFSISSIQEFTNLALAIFKYQYDNNEVYRRFVDACGLRPESVIALEQIPFLPIECYKTLDVVCGNVPPQAVFRSSGTTGNQRSIHMVTDLAVYRQSMVKGFERVYGPPSNYQFLALTPNPEQAPDSSLVYMIQHLMDLSESPENGFFLASPTGLHARLRQRRAKGVQVMLIGLSYALVDFANHFSGNYAPLTVVETGGMKGQKKELTREGLHSLLKPALGVDIIHSEYGMTELLSQAWSIGEGYFTTPPWMKVLIREPKDPMTLAKYGVTGGINIIDLANYHSCCFIATQDLGKMHEDGRFEVLGRFNDADVRGCNLME